MTKDLGIPQERFFITRNYIEMSLAYETSAELTLIVSVVFL